MRRSGRRRLGGCCGRRLRSGCGRPCLSRCFGAARQCCRLRRCWSLSDGKAPGWRGRRLGCCPGSAISHEHRGRTLGNEAGRRRGSRHHGLWGRARHRSNAAQQQISGNAQDQSHGNRRRRQSQGDLQTRHGPGAHNRLQNKGMRHRRRRQGAQGCHRGLKRAQIVCTGLAGTQVLAHARPLGLIQLVVQVVRQQVGYVPCTTLADPPHAYHV